MITTVYELQQQFIAKRKQYDTTAELYRNCGHHEMADYWLTQSTDITRQIERMQVRLDNINKGRK